MRDDTLRATVTQKVNTETPAPTAGDIVLDVHGGAGDDEVQIALGGPDTSPAPQLFSSAAASIAAGDGRDDVVGRSTVTGTWRVFRSTASAFLIEDWGDWARGLAECPSRRLPGVTGTRRAARDVCNRFLARSERTSVRHAGAVRAQRQMGSSLQVTDLPTRARQGGRPNGVPRHRALKPEALPDSRRRPTGRTCAGPEEACGPWLADPGLNPVVTPTAGRRPTLAWHFRAVPSADLT